MDNKSGESNLPKTCHIAIPPAELAALKTFCSRLAGEPYCRCGSNLFGRFCLWSYYRDPSDPAAENNEVKEERHS